MSNRWTRHVEARRDQPGELADFLRRLVPDLEEMSESMVEQLREAVGPHAESSHDALAGVVKQILGDEPVADDEERGVAIAIRRPNGDLRWEHPGTHQEVLDDVRKGRVPTDAWPYPPTVARGSRGKLLRDDGQPVGGELHPDVNGFRATLGGETLEHAFGPEPLRTELWLAGTHVATWWHREPLEDRWSEGALPRFWREGALARGGKHQPLFAADAPDGGLWLPDAADDAILAEGDSLRWRRTDGSLHPQVLPRFEDEQHVAAFRGASDKRGEDGLYRLGRMPVARLRQLRLPDGARAALAKAPGESLRDALEALEGVDVVSVSAPLCSPDEWKALCARPLDRLEVDFLPEPPPPGWAEASWKRVWIGGQDALHAFRPVPAGCKALRTLTLTVERLEDGWRAELPNFLDTPRRLASLHAASELPGSVAQLVLKGRWRGTRLFDLASASSITAHRLVVRQARLTDSSVAALQAWRPRVACVDVSGNHLTARGLAALEQAGFDVINEGQWSLEEGIRMGPLGAVHGWYQVAADLFAHLLGDDADRPAIQAALRGMRRLRSWNPKRTKHAERARTLAEALDAPEHQALQDRVLSYAGALEVTANTGMLFLPHSESRYDDLKRAGVFRDEHACGPAMSQALLDGLTDEERPVWTDRLLDAMDDT